MRGRVVRDNHWRRRRRMIVATIVTLPIRGHLASRAQRRRKGRFLFSARRGSGGNQRTSLAFMQRSLQLLRSAFRRRARRARSQEFLRVLLVAFVASSQFIAKALRFLPRGANQVL